MYVCVSICIPSFNYSDKYREYVHIKCGLWYVSVVPPPYFAIVVNIESMCSQCVHIHSYTLLQNTSFFSCNTQLIVQ